MEGCLVTGTQADRRNKNQLMMLRYTNLHKTQVKDEAEEDNEDMESDESEEEEEEEGSTKKDPRHYCIAIPHDGSVNRVRSKNVVSADGGVQNVLTASWSDTGRVHIWDLQSAYNELFAISLDTPSTMLKRSVNPAFSVTKHKTEGFALAWGPLVSGRLISGDCNGQICLTEATSERIETAGETFRGHSDSVEDLQWSPSEATVFASSSVDKTVRIWDIRLPRHQSALSATVHDSDVNVLSWNRHATHMIATGADDGSFATWDLRRWAPNSDGGDALSRFTWHRDAVTSIEWSPHDVSVLAVAGADDQLTIWDFEVEESSGEVLDGRTVPSQLLFIHQGQKEIKELHWHPQLSGVLVSTALSGFNIFKTISV
jgi:ribosome assembly protein RRB1